MTQLLLPAYALSEPNRVHCCDALALLNALPSGSVDCVLTDPPYGVGSQVSARRSPEERFKEIANVDILDATWLPQAYRAMKATSALYVFAKWVNVGEWKNEIVRAGFTVRNCIIWDKKGHGTGDLFGAYAPQYEMILFAVKDSHKLRGTRPTDIIRYPKVQPQNLLHPYEKPVGLLEQLIRNSTDPGALIVDCFCGSGTTLLAANKNGRAYMGCDVALEYVELARQRLTLGYTVPMFAEVSHQPKEELPAPVRVEYIDRHTGEAVELEQKALFS